MFRGPVRFPGLTVAAASLHRQKGRTGLQACSGVGPPRGNGPGYSSNREAGENLIGGEHQGADSRHYDPNGDAIFCKKGSPGLT